MTWLGMHFGMAGYAQRNYIKLVFDIISFVVMILGSRLITPDTFLRSGMWQIAFFNSVVYFVSSSFALFVPFSAATISRFPLGGFAIARLGLFELLGFVILGIVIFAPMIACSCIGKSAFFTFRCLPPLVGTFLFALSTLCLKPAFYSRFFSEGGNGFFLTAFCARFCFHRRIILCNRKLVK